MSEDLAIVTPRLDLADAYADMVTDWRSTGEDRVPFTLDYADDDFPALVQRLADDAAGVDLPEGWVPCSTYWLLVGGTRLVAVANLRHRLTPALEKYGGHIGYGVRPSDRRRGYGSFLLAGALVHARARGIDRVLITCDPDNIGSNRIITNNGGVLDDTIVAGDPPRPTNRYWIALGME